MQLTKKLLDQVISAAKACRPIMTGAFSVAEKHGASNLVTTADTAVQERLRALLKNILPDAGFLGEESPEAVGDTLFWVVDPIDGTSNFVRGMGLSVIAIALVDREQPVLGVVYNPFTEEVFSAAKNMGAWCNGVPLHVSQRDFSHSMLFMAYSVYEKRYAGLCESVVADLYARCDDFRRLGSAALELCYIAAGRAELYFEMRIFPWDWAAASVVLREAGGRVGTIDRASLRYDRPVLFLAANSEENFTELKETVQRYIPELPYTE